MKKKVMIRLSTIFILLSLYFIYIYFNLDIGEKPRNADVIVVLEGGADDRARKAVQLLHNGYSNCEKIIVSPRNLLFGFDNAQWYYDAGAKAENIIFEYDSTSTWTNAINTLEIMKEQEYNSALIVTSDYHTRRSKLVFERVNNKENYEFDLTYIASDPVEDSNIPNNHSLRKKLLVPLHETIRYIGYLLGLYHFSDL